MNKLCHVSAGNIPTEENVKLYIERLDILFSSHCPALDQEVYMRKVTWFNHIVRYKPIMRGKDGLIKNKISEIFNKSGFFRFGDYPRTSWFHDFRVPHFEKLYNYMRIAFKKIDHGIIIVSSAYPEERGILHYEQ